MRKTMETTKYNEWENSYCDGYRNGKIDRQTGRDALIVALTSPNKDYARGYRDGYTTREIEII